MSVFAYYFGWPHGQIWPNLIASLVCAGVVWWRLHVQAVAHHVEVLVQAERFHRDLKAHVTAAAGQQSKARQSKTLVTKPAKGDA